MNQNLTPLGYARVFRNPQNGEVIIDEDSIGRRGFQGELVEPVYGGPIYGYEGYPEYEYPEPEPYAVEGYPAYAGPAYAGPLYAGDEYYVDGFGALRRKTSKHQISSRPPSRTAPQPRPAQPRGYVQPPRQPTGRVVTATPRHEAHAGENPLESMGMTALAGSQTLTDPGTATITIRVQHFFEATDVTFEGSSSGAKITGIAFGPRPVLTAPDGISTSVFTPTSQMRRMLQGQRIDPGLDIVVTGVLGSPGSLNAVFFGLKPLGQG